MMRKFFIVMIALLGFSSSKAQQSPEYRFSLEEAIQFALANNRDAQNATRDIKAAEKQKWEVAADGLPQINANIDYQNFLKEQVLILPAEIVGGDPGEFTSLPFPKQSVNAFATLDQLIFDGSYIVALQAANVFLDISRNAKEKTDLEVRKAVIQAYGNVLLSQETVDIVRENLKTVQDNLDETKKYFDNGLAEEESVEQLQITASGLQNSLNFSLRALEVTKKLFNITLGIDLNATVELSENLDVLTLKNIDYDLVAAENNILNNIDYRIALNDLKADSLQVKRRKSAAIPTINAFINGGYQGASNDFRFFSGSQEWFGQSAFGISLNVPIFSSLQRSAATQRAKIELDKSQVFLTDTEQRLKLDIDRAKNEYQFAIDNYKVRKENLDLAERIEKKNQTKYFEGIATSLELRQAQLQLYTAQQDYLDSMVRIINAKADLETLLNTDINLVPNE